MAERIATSTTCGSANGPYRVLWTLTYDQLTPIKLTLGIGETAHKGDNACAHATSVMLPTPCSLQKPQHEERAHSCHKAIFAFSQLRSLG